MLMHILHDTCLHCVTSKRVMFFFSKLFIDGQDNKVMCESFFKEQENLRSISHTDMLNITLYTINKSTGLTSKIQLNLYDYLMPEALINNSAF